MSSLKYDLIGIGNAIVDVVAPADDAFLSKPRHAARAAWR